MKQSDFLILDKLVDLNRDAGEAFKSDVVILKSPIRFGLDDLVRNTIEGVPDKSAALTVFIETTGGFVEVVERIHNVFRKNYRVVNFVVPNFAYSAGTILALSGDNIYMDYYSVLGPIDPQLENDNERFVSGLGYLEKFNELTDRINSASSSDQVRAELAYLLKKFDPAELFDLEQARTHSEELLTEWLSCYKFKDWVTTTTGKAVTHDMRKERAKDIAGILGNPKRWHSHGRGIGIKELVGEEIKLQIEDFGKDESLNTAIQNYYGLFIDYCGKIGASSSTSTVLHSKSGLRRM